MDSSATGLTLSPADFDAWVRTAATEDASNPLAVASVIANRYMAGGYGDSPTSVVRAPGQFEVWNNGRAQALNSNSPQYQQAAEAVRAVASGQAPDPTNGATHFYSPSGQAALGRSPPSWGAKNVTAQIGGHIYSAPNGPVQRNAGAADANPDDVFSELTAHAQGNAAQSVAAPPSPGAASVDDVFGELAAHANQNNKPAATTPATNPGMTPPPQAPVAPQNTGDASAAIGRGILDGVPIAGPYLLSGAQKAAALARVATFGGTYEDALKHVQEFGKNTADQHPYATTAGNVLGVTAATLPLIEAAPALFGVGAPSGMQAIATGGATAGVLAGADAAVRSGGDPYESLKAAGIGAVTGGLGPVVGKGVGYTANKLMSAASDIGSAARDGISASTRNLLLDSIHQDGPQFVQSELQRLGPNGMLADVGSALQGRAQGTAIREGGSGLIQAIKDRAAGANARIREAVAGLGPAEDPQTVTDNILALRKTQDATNYGAIRTSAPPVDVQNVVDLIDRQLGPGGAEGAQKTALQNLRQKLVTGEAQPATGPQASTILDASGNPVMTPGTPAQPEQLQTAFNNLHNLKGEIDGLIDNSAPGLGVERGAVNRQQGSLKAVRGALNDALETQVPGYAEANSASSALAKRAEAVKAGVDTLDSGKTAPTPQRFIDDFNQKSVGEQVAQAKGLIAEANRRVGVNSNDLGAMRTALQGEEGWNAAKMARVIGAEPTNRLLAAVEQEGHFGGTFNKVVGNAQTAFRNQSSAGLDKASPFGVDVDISKVSTPGAILGTLKGAVYNPLIKFMASTDTAARDAELAKILSATGARRDAFVNKLFQAAGRAEATPAWSKALGNAGNAFISGMQEPYRLAR